MDWAVVRRTMARSGRPTVRALLTLLACTAANAAAAVVVPFTSTAEPTVTFFQGTFSNGATFGLHFEGAPSLAFGSAPMPDLTPGVPVNENINVWLHDFNGHPGVASQTETQTLSFTLSTAAGSVLIEQDLSVTNIGNSQWQLDLLPAATFTVDVGPGLALDITPRDFDPFQITTGLQAGLQYSATLELRGAIASSEPATVAMLLMGLAGLGMARRRKIAT